WPGERWLDVGRLDLLQPIMGARLDICVEKGFDAVDVDNVDGYTQDSGFDISWDEQIAYNRWLAQAAEDRGLAAGLKNDLDQVSELVGDYEFSVNEQCFLYRECKLLKPFIDANKPVLNIEYELERRRFCPRAREMRFSSIRKRMSLRAWRRPC
ncbi:MAG TPA: endo alpha-1,4 polygalactosaminidase, partial [Actinomycetota bacterium]|nr:endo alpha-1,4 polygalactosaminidase [Actinomycetota bacterium]